MKKPSSLLFPFKALFSLIFITLLAQPAGAAASELFISEYIEGSSYNKAIEIYNGTGAAIDMGAGGYTLELYSNGASSASSTHTLSGTVANGDVYVLAHASAAAAILAQTDVTSATINFNGDDAVVLRKGGVVIDAFGQVGFDPGSQWTGGGQDDTLRRKDTICAGDANADDAFDASVEWDIFAKDTFDGLGSHSVICGGETAPSVTSTTPANGASNVAVDANINLNFNEAVNTSGSWFDISCSSSGAHTATVSGGPTSFTIDPDTDFAESESCTVTIIAAQVTDQDSEDPPDAMESDHVFSFDTAGPATLVINEFQADPASGLAGDANGDGTRDSSKDEFIELVNVSGSDMDISGWTLADGWGLRHTFPSGSVVLNGCSVVVFGGGTPTGYFGKSLVQTASGGSLGLNNDGDTITLNDGSSDVTFTTYGSEGADNQSLTLVPDGTGTPPYTKHTVATGSDGARFSPGTKIDGSKFDGCPLPMTINEILADPASDLPGDANGDGTRDYSDDEFVEIVNESDANMDISGWTLADGSSVRHTFPSGSVVLAGCSVVVFGGDTPTGSFGNSLVQTASGGSLSLGNSGDSVTLDDSFGRVVTASYTGSEGSDNQSITLDPDITGTLPWVKHSVATGSGGALFSPGTKIDGTQFDGCPIAAEIYEIQGSGEASPLAGKLVMTDSDVVTAVAPDGFFMQTPAAGSDGNINTSDGVFVFTGAAPVVSIGNLVDVKGTVDEFYGFTEISGSPAVDVVGSGPLPAPIVFDATVPSPDPTAPSCAIEFECYEGMQVTITNGTVTGPNQRFNPEPIAEVHITAADTRTYREPGIEFPGIAPYPEWDGNPEVFELDPDKLGLANEIIPAGSHFDATGMIGFEFNGYELWPTSLTVYPATLPQPVRARAEAEMTVAALNLFRLFNDVDDGNEKETVVSSEEYARRLAKFSDFILTVMDAPDVLAVSEAESLSVLQDLADAINLDDAAVSYTPYLVEGNDVGGIDVGFLVLDTVVVDDITQLGKDEVLDYDGSLLNDRPPLLLEGRQVADGSDFPIAVMAIHSRSLSGIEHASDGERVRQKRLEQAEFVAGEVQTLYDANPDINLVVIGDFNAFEFSDSYVDVTGHMKGDFLAEDNLVCETNDCFDLLEPNLIDQVLMIPQEERYSFIFWGNAQALDHALTSEGLDELVRDFSFARGNADAAFDLRNDDSTPLRSSDHDGLVLYLVKDSDGDGVTDDADYCPATVIPESAPTRKLRTNNFALVDDDRLFDTLEPKGKGPQMSFDIFDTAGCSCEQIVVEQGLGMGHLKFGCSIGEMEAWVEFLNQP